jgi:phage-related protein
MNLGFSKRPLAWLDGALDVCLTFPSRVRRRIGCELVCLRRSGIGRSWEPVRGAAGAASLAARLTPRGSLPEVYRIFIATSLPEAVVIVHASMRHAVRGKPWAPPADVSSVRARVLDVALDMQERRTVETVRAPRRPMTDNVFLQLGFPDGEADALARRADLIAELRRVLRRRGNDDADVVTRAVFDGDMDAVTIEPLQQLFDRLGARDLTTW